MLRLASASPRRIDLLERLGVRFEAIAPDVDEARAASPAAAKADAVAGRGAPTLAIDTVIVAGERRAGKPRDPGDAVTVLADLAARGTHAVRSEVVIVTAAGRRLRFAVRTSVEMRDASLREIERYVATGEPLDKAGAYAIQGGGARFVARVDGCFANVVGMPLCHVYHALRRAGVSPRERPERVCQERFEFVCPVWRLAHRQGRALYDGAEYDSSSEDVSGVSDAPAR